MAEVSSRLARVLERDAPKLGVDHHDAGPVDREAWRALMPGKRSSARESSAVVRLRAMDADIELLKARQVCALQMVLYAHN